MKIDGFAVYHYLYGYQPMRLASQNEIDSHQRPEEKTEVKFEETGLNGATRDDICKSATIKTPRKIRPPVGIALCISSIPGEKFGACALKDIPIGTWFGPYEGRLVRRNECITGSLSESMWEIFHDGEVSHFLDGLNQNTWMSFVKCARHKKEQNMVVFQYHGCIYYRTIREIVPGSELLVWYDSKYTQLLGLPVAWNDSKNTNGKRKVVSNGTNDNVKRKRAVEGSSKESSLITKENGIEKAPNQQLRTSSKNHIDHQFEAAKREKEARPMEKSCLNEVKHELNNDVQPAYTVPMSPHIIKRPYPEDIYSPGESRRILGSNSVFRPFTEKPFDKQRQLNENWQARTVAYNSMKFPSHANKTQDICHKIPVECLRSYEKHHFSPPQITMTSHIHDYQNYYYNHHAIKHEDRCHFKDANAIHRPMV